MPEIPQSPSRTSEPASAGVRAASAVGYVELAVRSNFTFLKGASHPDELVAQAATLGHRAAALADTNSLAGVVRAHVAAERLGFPFLVGCRLVLRAPAGASENEPPERRANWLTLIVYPTCVKSYGRLCRLLTLGKRRAEKGGCHLGPHDLLDHRAGLIALALPPAPSAAPADDDRLTALLHLRRAFGKNDFFVATAHGDGSDAGARLARARHLAQHLDAPTVAVHDVLCHVPARRPLQDVVECIRRGCTLDAAGFGLNPSAHRALVDPREMARRFADDPEAIHRTVQIAERAGGFSLSQLRYRYPGEVVPAGSTAMQHLARLTWQNAGPRLGHTPPVGGWPQGPGAVAGASTVEPFPAPAWLLPGVERPFLDTLTHELNLIAELGYAHYFLTVEDLVAHARGRGILCQGRGAAANSVVCYCLGVTDADPRRINTLFERFVSRERKEPPDIDIDFEHDRREEVIQYLYAKYGRDRAALCANVITYRGRSAVREVGKALGLSLDVVDRLAKGIDGWHGGPVTPEQLGEMKLDPRKPAIQHLVRLSAEIQGFPRHLGQHSGGFVLTEEPLSELVPIENAAMANRTTISWDKDDIDAVGMLKVDVLAIGLLSALSRVFGLLETQGPEPDQDPERDPEPDPEPDPQDTGPLRPKPARPIRPAPPRSLVDILRSPDDSATYDMICRADTVGVFQIESRAQMSMLPRLKPRCFYDLVIQVAIVRPGPIQGDMVHPYLRRRRGEEPIDYPDDKVEWILGKTLGVPLFQEQAMQLAIHCAGFTPDGADKLRRAVTGFRHTGQITAFGEQITEGMIERGYTREFAERVFSQIQGFSHYGFPESHAASFAILTYASSYLKCHFPAAFCCALLNSQPMGFYAPAQLIQDAQRHGVQVRPVDALVSQWECTLESAEGEPAGSDGSVRLGLNRVRGLSEDDGRRVALASERARARGDRFVSVESLWRAAGCSAAAMRRLATADAFAPMGLDRQSAIWHARKLKDDDAPLFTRSGVWAPDQPLPLPELPELRHVVADHAATGVSLRPHVFCFLRSWLDARGAATAEELLNEAAWPAGKRVSVAGLCLVRQRPGTAKSLTFMTLEDETGFLNLVVWPDVFERHRRVARHATAMLVRGRIDRAESVVHVRAASFETLDPRVVDLKSVSRNFH